MIEAQVAREETKAPTEETPPSEDWGRINWRKLEKYVYRLQKRIYRASAEGRIHTVHSLERLLMNSRAARTLAVRRVTQDNRGKKTAGIDGVKSVSPEDRRIMVERLRRHATLKAQPVRRVYIPKPGKDEKRPLGIPVMLDRAHQALAKLALEPQWEACFEPNSYGFRPGRSAHDAIGAIFLEIRQKDKYVLDADIKGCFDEINHQALLAKLHVPPVLHRSIKTWLQTGVMEGQDFSPTSSGTPQGGVVSPLLANIALHGLEDVAKTAYRRKDAGGTLVRPTLIRYADDFVVLCADKDGVLQAQKAIAEWLDGIGLRLHPSKTRVTHTLHLEGGQIGFDFLGFNIRQYPVGKTRTGTNRYGRPLGFKTLITPSKDAVKRHMTEVGKVVADHRGAPQAALIGRLNPLINGWCAYHRTVVAKRTFADCDNQLYAQLRSWAKFRHPSKPQKWIVRRYWSMHPGARWDFVWKRQGQIVYRLRDHAATPIKRHVKVKGTASPYDGNLVYWARRLAEHPLTSSETGKLLRRQAGKCARCGLYIREEDCYEIDHIIPRSCGGNDLLLNKQILHGHCHQRKTAEEADGCR